MEALRQAILQQAIRLLAIRRRRVTLRQGHTHLLVQPAIRRLVPTRRLAPIRRQVMVCHLGTLAIATLGLRQHHRQRQRAKATTLPQRQHSHHRGKVIVLGRKARKARKVIGLGEPKKL